MSSKICTRCCMDTDDPNIQFDVNGVCNHCHEWDAAMKAHTVPGMLGLGRIQQITEKIKASTKGKEFNCVMGLSGGTDSSLVAYRAKEFGLKPYCISVDNGYDTPESAYNVNILCRRLETPLHTIRLDQKEFKDLQLSYLKAGVINLETPSDMAINASVHEAAAKLGLHYIVSGQNIATEWTMPKAWGWDNNDAVNLCNIHKDYGTIPLKTFPVMGHRKFQYYVIYKQITTVPILNYMEYKRLAAKAMLVKELGWKDYGAKHHESIITRWFQCYVLPTYWKIDKRKAHLSCLIRNGEIGRFRALEELSLPPCPEAIMKRDMEFVCNYLGLTQKELIFLLNTGHTPHETYGTEGRPGELTLSLYHFYLKLRGKK